MSRMFRTGRWVVVVPAVFASVWTLAACSTEAQPAPESATYSMPAVFTGNPVPPSVNAEIPDEIDSAVPVNGATVPLIDRSDTPLGVAQLKDISGDVAIDVHISGGHLDPGLYTVGFTEYGRCDPAIGFHSAGAVRSLLGGTSPLDLTLPVSSSGVGAVETLIPGIDVASLTGRGGSAIVLTSESGERVGCGVIDLT
ncbi:hypothetical protein [Tomitella cavernea]|nr:hypothetical protein [Tomitella cavernea]